MVAGRVLLHLLQPFAYPTYLCGVHYELEGDTNVVMRQGPPPKYYPLNSLRCRVGKLLVIETSENRLRVINMH